MKIVHVVIGIILNSNQEVLIARRLPHQERPGAWEFPGGKVEANESPYAALQREFFEEIGIQVTAAEHWMNVRYDYPHKSVLLDTWMITQYDGIPSGAEGQAIAWGTKADLQTREFPEGNRLIIEKLLFTMT
jgi:8-oxo-dGTP diphosphatase